MTPLVRSILCGCLLTLTFAGPSLAQKKTAPALRILDEAGLFSPEAKQKAEAEIARLKSQHNKDLLIETRETVTRPKDLDAKDTKAVNRFFDTWAQEQFANHRVDGVYIVIVKNPTKLREVVGAETQRRGLFTSDNQVALNREMVTELKAGNYDKALLRATEFVGSTMDRNARSAAAPGANPVPRGQPVPQVQQEVPPWVGYLCVGVAIFAGIWLVSALFRAMSGGGGAPGMAPGYGGGGGGFMSSLLGGLFGAAAGMWMYNNFFGGHSAHAGDYSSGGGYGSDPGGADVGGGPPSTTGGDWGDGGGGGDLGGGGGGDWGGGGGGDWGGGGGGGDW